MRLDVVGVEHVIDVALVVRLGLGGVVVLPVTVGNELRAGLSAVLPPPSRLPPAHMPGSLDRRTHLVEYLLFLLRQGHGLLEYASALEQLLALAVPVVECACNVDFFRWMFPCRCTRTWSAAAAICLKA